MIKIGIPLWKIGDNSFGSTINYINFASRFGNVIPLMYDEPARNDLNLLLLPGGLDINPLRYNEKPGFYTSKSDLYKEYFDEMVLPDYINQGTPIFGICRGLQTLGVTFNGKLVQHMYHETNSDDDGYKSMHKVEIIQHLPKLNINKNTIFDVNSRHHQVIRENTMDKNMVVIGRYHGKKYQNTIEAIAHKELAIAAVQWHPEDNYSSFVDLVINHLIYNQTSII